jgi:cytochrome b561
MKARSRTVNLGIKNFQNLKKIRMKKYSKRMVVIHWLTLLFFVAAIYLGYTVSQARQIGDATLAAYLSHLLVGDLILVLTLVRLFFKRKDDVLSRWAMPS